MPNPEIICREKQAEDKIISGVFVEDCDRYLGDSLLQSVEGVNHGHVPPLTFGERTDDLTGITLSTQLQTEQLEPPQPSDIPQTSTNQLFRLDTEELDGLCGVLCHSQRQVWVYRRNIQLAARKNNCDSGKRSCPNVQLARDSECNTGPLTC